MLDPLTNTTMITTLLALLALSIFSDVRARRIPNRLVVTGLIIGFIGQGILAGPVGLVLAIIGAVAGFLCLLPFYVTGGMGAGDVKLMAMCGAFLGPLFAVFAAVASLVIGGVIGVLWFFWQPGSAAGGDLEQQHAAQHATDPSGITEYPGHVDDGHSPIISPIPYAVAIGGGVVAALIMARYLIQAWQGGLS